MTAITDIVAHNSLTMLVVRRHQAVTSWRQVSKAMTRALVPQIAALNNRDDIRRTLRRVVLRGCWTSQLDPETTYLFTKFAQYCAFTSQVKARIDLIYGYYIVCRLWPPGTHIIRNRFTLVETYGFVAPACILSVGRYTLTCTLFHTTERDRDTGT